MDYVLKGSLYKETIANLDKTLTVEGLAADAKAVGDALNKLAPADNLTTDDASKPLSARQGKLLDEKLTFEVSELRGEIKDTDVGKVKATADEALEKASSAKVIAENAQMQVENALEMVVWTVNGVAPDRNHNINVSTDSSLTLENIPADAKAVGEALKKGGGAVDASLSVLGMAADAYMTGYRLTELEAKVIELEASKLPNAEGVGF